MNHLVEFLIGLLVLFLTFEDSEESQPYSWASHVCSRGTYEMAYTSYRTYRTRYQDYHTKCGWWDWGRCKKTRSWRSYYYESRTKSVYKTYYYCCSGWRQSGRYCSIPICSSGCGHGRCTSPNRCSCNSGWQGYRCQYDVNECSRSLGGCSQVCINTPGSYKCGCRKGYVLEGSKLCKNKDECATRNGQCDHICENTYGSYKCRCFLGYKLLPDGRTCLASNEMYFPPSLVPTPSVTYRNDYSSMLEMVCSFDFPAWNNVSYLIEWYANSIKPVNNETWCIAEEGERTSNHSSCTRRQSVITFSQHFTIGDTVWCKLYMKFSTSSKNNWTESGIQSNQFYVGIEVSPRHTIVDQCKVLGRTKNISVTLRPTVPILPFMNLHGTDSVVVYVMIPEKTQVSVDKCRVELKTEDITIGKTINIGGICGKENHTNFFHFKQETSSPDWFSGVYQMPSMKVTTHPKQFQYGNCFIMSGKHLRTFDSRIVSLRQPGFFVMYTNEDQKLQVYMRTVSTKNKWLGNPCGVTIREGKSVLVLSICDELISEQMYPTKRQTRNLHFFKRSPGVLSKGIQKIKNTRREGEILLSSGLRIVVTRMGFDDLRILIKAPITDKGKVSGLCGNFNGNKYDDFVDIYRIDLDLLRDRDLSIHEDKSYFKALPQEEEESEPQEIYCFCSMTNQIQTKVECNTTETHFAKIDENERRLVTKSFRNAFGSFGKSSDCANNKQAPFCR